MAMSDMWPPRAPRALAFTIASANVAKANAVTVHWLGADQLRIRRRRRPFALGLPIGLLVLFAGAVWWAGPITGTGLALLTVGGVLVPLTGLRALRAFRPQNHVLVRGGGRLLLNGEGLDIARLELRVLKHPLWRRPSGYALSLWALIGRGDPVDLELGEFSTMLEAAMLSGQLEEFLERARSRAGATSQ